ncbi:helix-turn-helix domain-containing protein [uncultured Paraglaciecola sp.]|uniref:helix-turn-helix domain-containing protein n=1 Tax=uncultured Paraglaciecola sp. TaxID=1765024 RepID=UPI0030D858FD|tara:strand:+ start:148898 stop:149662 length:765 start_codon:yes stop_codon:yes gene_type:complete
MKSVNLQKNDYYNETALLDTFMARTYKDNNLIQGHSHRIFQRRDSLFSAGDVFEGVYILRSGSAKAFITSREGEEHITKFYYPGDMIGMDGFDVGMQTQSVRFLETSSVCLINTSQVNSLLSTNKGFRDGLLQSMSHSLTSDSAMMMCLSTCSSEQKVARFLLDLSIGFSERGLSGGEFILSMTRTDIASYLGMAIETVSRIFASFQERQLIAVQQRFLTILDFAALNQCVSIDVCANTADNRSRLKKSKQTMN